ncbi:MAG TPA: lysophospholipase [Spirochaetia bacterium]|nr:lysophospholipase [Spirochaetia bacterium]
MTTYEGLIGAADDTELFIRKDLPEKAKAVFVFVHGLCEHSGRYEYVAQKFNQFGYGVYRYDNRGHGKSGGDRGYIDNFLRFVDDADVVVNLAKKDNPGLPLFILGHSMGGLIAACYGVKYGHKLAGQVLSGALVIELPSMAELKKVDFDALRGVKSPNSLARLICRDEAVVNDYEKDPLVLKETELKLLGEIGIRGPAWLARNIKDYACPCLIVHGGADRIVIPEAAKWLYENISSQDKQLKFYEGLFHEILNEKERGTVIGDIHSWVEKRL